MTFSKRGVSRAKTLGGAVRHESLLKGRTLGLCSGAGPQAAEGASSTNGRYDTGTSLISLGCPANRNLRPHGSNFGNLCRKRCFDVQANLPQLRPRRAHALRRSTEERPEGARLPALVGRGAPHDWY